MVALNPLVGIWIHGAKELGLVPGLWRTYLGDLTRLGFLLIGLFFLIASGASSEYSRSICEVLPLRPERRPPYYCLGLPRNITRTNSGCPGAVRIKPSVKLPDHPQATASVPYIVESRSWMCGPADAVPDDPESCPLLLRVLLHKPLEAVFFCMSRVQLRR
jgi:hypothetical protein